MEATDSYACYGCVNACDDYRLQLLQSLRVDPVFTYVSKVKPFALVLEIKLKKGK